MKLAEARLRAFIREVIIENNDNDNYKQNTPAAFERAFSKAYVNYFNKNHNMTLYPVTPFKTESIRNWTFEIDGERHNFYDLAADEHETIDDIINGHKSGEYDLDDLVRLFVLYFESVGCISNDHSIALKNDALAKFKRLSQKELDEMYEKSQIWGRKISYEDWYASQLQKINDM